MNDIPDIAGEKLITAAYLFGGAGFVFATLPFLGVIIAGIVKGNGGNSNKSPDILTIVLWAFVVHTVSCFLFMGMIKILDNLNLDYPNLYTTKVFPIFWAETKESVYTLAGVQSGMGQDILSGVAYSTLHMMQVLSQIFFLIVPLSVFVLAFIYGAILGVKDSYDKNITSFLAYSSISFVVVAILYLFWAYIAGFAMFMPDGMSVVDMVSKIYTQLLKI